MSKRESSNNDPELTLWNELSAEEQLRLRVEYGQYLDQHPPTCSLEEKNTRFARWLAERQVYFSG